MASFDFPLQFKRQFEGPMDFHAEFATTADRNSFLTDGRRYAGMVVYDKQTNRLYVLNSGKNAWLDIPTSARTWEQYYEVDEVKTDSLTGVDADFSGNLRIGGNLTVNGATTTINSTTINLGDTNGDTLNINAGPVNLPSAISSGEGLIFGGTANCNLYKNTANQLQTDGDLFVKGDLYVPGGKFELGYDIGASQNDGAILEMDYSEGTDSGKFYIQTRDNGTEPFIFRQLTNTSTTYEPMTIGRDNKVGVGNKPVGILTFPSELTVYGSISATSDIKLGGSSSLIIGNTDSDANSVNLYRSGNNILKTDDDFVVGGNFTVVGSTITLPSQAINTVLAGPGSGGSAAPTFRALVEADIPGLNASKINAGTLPVARGGTNSDTALANGRVMISNGGSIVESSTITTTELGYLNNVTSNVQTQIDGLKDQFNYAATTAAPVVYVGTLSGISGGAAYTLDATSIYELTYAIQSTNTNTPVPVISANQNFDYINPNTLQPNNFLLLRSCVDLDNDPGAINGYAALNPRFIITKSSSTSLLVGLTGMTKNPNDVGSTANSIFAGSFVRLRKIS